MLLTLVEEEIYRVVMLLPLKQGLKLTVPVLVSGVRKVVMLLPLKQGLKHFRGAIIPVQAFHSCYATSIKTRIETLPGQKQWKLQRSCYATSIKTRIETFYPLQPRVSRQVVMLLPLKQGLKQ